MIIIIALFVFRPANDIVWF